MSLMSSLLSSGSVLCFVVVGACLFVSCCSYLLLQCYFSPKNETSNLLTSDTSQQFNNQFNSQLQIVSAESGILPAAGASHFCPE